MKNCQNCMAPIEDDAKFCTTCGAPQSATSAPDASSTAVSASAADSGSEGSKSEGGAAPRTSQAPQGGASFEGQAGQPFSAPGQGAPAGGYASYQQQPYQQSYVAAYDANDHTAQFDPRDISDNKIYAMLCYLLSFVGIIVALLAAPRSPYCQFHLRQAVKLLILETITVVACSLLFWTLIVPFVGSIFLIVLTVIQVVCFFQVCGGKAKDALIVRSCNFMK